MIQFTIYSFFAFIISASVILYILLSYGISLEKIALAQFKAEQLYIKLDKKLIIHAKRIDVTYGNAESERDPSAENLKLHPIINFARQNLHSLRIDELNINDYKVSFSYKESPLKPEDNSIIIKSDTLQARLEYRIYDDFLIVDMSHFTYKTGHVTVNAKVLVDFKQQINYVHLALTLPDSATLELYAKENKDALAFTAYSDKITDLGPIVDLFGLEKNISQWIVEHNRAASYQLLAAHGIYAYRTPETITETLFVHAREKELNYTFNPVLPPVSAGEADVYFSQNLLTILPKHASYAHHSIETGSVTIDFSHEHVMLVVDLNVHAQLDQEIVNIITAYNIPFPLLQKSGTTDAHLSLEVDLETEKASASGEFFIKNGEISLDGRDYKVKNGAVRLHKSFLSIDTAELEYKEIFSAKLNGHIDLSELTGNFYFDVEKVELPLSDTQTLKLVSSSPRLHLEFSKDSEALRFAKTRWVLNEQAIIVEANTLHLPHKFGSKAIIDALAITVSDIADAKISGSFDPKEGLADLDIRLDGLRYSGKEFVLSAQDGTLAVKLEQANGETRLSLPSETTFIVNENRIRLSPAILRFKKGYAELDPTELSVNDVFSTRLSASHLLGSSRAELGLEKSTIVSKKHLYIEPALKLLYEKQLDKHHFDIQDYGLHAIVNEKGESDLSIKTFSKLYAHSELMRRYDIKAGHAALTFIKDRVGMDIALEDFHPLLTKNAKEVKEYTIKGDYQDKTATLRINDQLDLVYRQKGIVTASNLEFNIFPIRDYLKFINNSEEKGNIQLKVKTKDCSLILGDSQRKIISDSIDIDIHPSLIHAELIYKKGGILFESQENNFSVFGRGLDDTFMNQLFKFSTFQGGVLSFMGQGNFDQFEGMTRIDNTIIKDYTVLNNTLAFFNTIPSLVTFSVPGYSKKGLKVSEMYTQFLYDNNKISIQGTKIKAKELTITAKGESDLDKDSIDLLMEVKTKIGSAAKNIPLIGYIIFGDETVSTTVRVHGNLSDPKVESSMAKSIIVAPYNIIKRTITLPFKILDLFESEEGNESKE